MQITCKSHANHTQITRKSHAKNESRLMQAA
jgi:hypothetical protein